MLFRSEECKTGIWSRRAGLLDRDGLIDMTGSFGRDDSSIAAFREDGRKKAMGVLRGAI